MSENLLVTYCSPTLAGMKTGNLFNCECHCGSTLQDVIAEWNEMLNPKGVYIKVMRFEKGQALIYVYRKTRLEKEINCSEIRAFLKSQGYECSCLERMLDILSQKLSAGSDFPHEIGVFLGYPFDDVKGFIENKGKNFKSVGTWKVYGNECAAKKLFSKYRKCTDVYCKRFKEGSDLLKLTVEGRHLA